jgi:hypothetical protein
MTTSSTEGRATRVDRLGAGYAVLVGLFMGAFWTASALTGTIPELRTAPLEIGYHLVAELLAPGALLAAGVGRLRGRAWAARLFPVALGMLLYTVVNSAGYDAERGDVAMVGMFAVLTVATLALLAAQLPQPSGGMAEAFDDKASMAAEDPDRVD